MSIHRSAKSARRLALLASALGVLLIAPGASAQDQGRYIASASASGPEEVYVYAPRLRVERAPLNGYVQKVSLARAVRYDDLNLRTERGARALRARVHEAALNICEELANVYPVPEMPGTSCYRSAVRDAMWRADSAIDDARGYSY
jgi:UrcA family protein